MFNKNTVVLDFGSQNLTVLVGKNGRNGLNLVGSGEVEYGGFIDGEFLELDKLGNALKQVLSIAEKNARMGIKEVYVGVPSAFCTVRVKNVNQNFSKKVRITERVLDELYFIGDDFSKFPTHEVISINLVDAQLDDGEIYDDIIGKSTSILNAKLTYVLCEKKFIDIVENLLKMLGVRVNAFILNSLAQAKYLLMDKDVDSAVIIDVGHITSSVSYIEKTSLVAMHEFSLGGGFITSDLMEHLHISYETADNLKKKVVLSFSPQNSDVYEVKNKNEVIEVSALTANAIVKERIIKIFKAINKSLQLNSKFLNQNTKFYMCGGGLSYIKGARDILSNAISTNVELLVPNIPQLEKPHYTSVLSLLFVACEHENIGIRL